MTWQPRPDFLVIGAARCATTYLSRVLNEHPDTAITNPKEPNFLALGNSDHRFAGPGDERTRTALVSDESAWRRLFENPDGRLVGEASVTTMYYPEIAIPKIGQFCPDARLVAIVRAPWDRARSAWMLLRGMRRETLDFGEALAAEPERITTGYESIWHYRSQSLYRRQLEPFLDRFGDQLLVAEYERMVADDSNEIARIERHLGIEPRPTPALGRVNSSSNPKYTWLRRPMSAAHSRPWLRQSVRTVLPARTRQTLLAALEVDDRSTPFPDGFVASFDQEIDELRELLGASAPSWTVRP